MTPKPTVSIVIPCYNYAGYIGLAIDSALAQTWPGAEVIVVDDGSTDSSPEVIAAYGGRIRAVRQANQGHVSAFNHGCALSRGDIVFFLDADDLLHPDAVRSVVQRWQPGLAKIQFNLALIGSAGQPLGREHCRYPRGYGVDDVRDAFLRSNTYVWPVCTGNAYARAFLKQVMPLGVRMAPDGWLNTVAPLYGDVLTIDRVLGSYRMHQNNQSYHGSGTHRAAERFVRQIALRRSEQHALKARAAALGRRLADEDLLDHELVFVNYRLMMTRLGQPYDGSSADSVVRLWRLGLRCLSARRLGWRHRLQHLAWLTLLAAVPGWAARWLVDLRFNRDTLMAPLRQARSGLRALVPWAR